MIIQKFAALLLFSSFSISLGMEGPMFFKFMAHIQNRSKNPITHIRCWGGYDICSEIEPRSIPVGDTLSIERGEGNAGIFKLLIAGQKHRIIELSDIVWSNFNAPHNPAATKRKYSGYRVKLDDEPHTEDFVPVVLNQEVHITVDENDKISFEVKPDWSKVSALMGSNNQ